MTLELKEETAKKLVSLAQKNGLTVDELLERIIPGLSSVEMPQADALDRAQAFRNWAANHSTNSPLLSDEAICVLRRFSDTVPS
jgi:hypothetical protein